MTTVTYSLATVGSIGSHVIVPNGSDGNAVTTQGGSVFISGEVDGSPVINAQLFNASLAPISNNFAIGGTGSNINTDAVVLNNGNIVTTYSNFNNGKETVYMKLLSSEGAIVKSSFSVPPIQNNQSDLHVAALHDGGYVVSWTKHYDNDTDVLAKVYDADGSSRDASDNSFIIESAANLSGLGSDVVGLTNGNFVVAYTQTPAGGGNLSIYFDLLTPAGTHVLPKHAVDIYGSINDQVSAVALHDGGFALAWQDNGFNNSDTDIDMLIYNADGTVRTDFIRVNATDLKHAGGDTGGYQGHPALAQMKNGDIIVSWDSNSGPTGVVNARAFDPQGHAVTGITRLSAATAGDGYSDPSLTSSGAAGAIAVFTRDHGGAGDLVGGGIDLVRTSTGTSSGETIKGDELTDRMSGQGGKDKLLGGDGNDTISGGKDDDKLSGGDGSDMLAGGKGDDTLKGGNDGDTLDGGKGADKLYAGKGGSRDTFTFGKGGSSVDDPDRIFGFDQDAKHEAASDKIDLSHLDVKWRDVALNDDGKNVQVSVDYKGSGKSDMVIEVIKVDHLSHHDFIL